MKKLLSKKGFTLIELLIVITIIGILAVALLPSVLGAPARARDAQRKADLNNIVAALETYNSDKQGYPTVSGCISNTTTGPGINLVSYFQGSKIPNDPQGKGVGSKCTNGYLYCKLTGANVNYALASFVEVAGDGNYKTGTADLCSASPKIPDTKPPDADTYVIIK